MSFGATWRMLIKLLTEARKGRENSSAKRSEARKGRENSSARCDKFGATWRMLIKLLTEARKGRNNRARSGGRTGTYS